MHTENVDHNNDPIARILLATRVIAIVGLSPKAERPSHGVASFLLARGYEIVPVNPACEEILGRRCYPDLLSIPPELAQQMAMVDVFRRSEEVAPIAQQAVLLGAQSLWLQLGISNAEAMKIARAGGLMAVEDRCVKIDYLQRFGLQPVSAVRRAVGYAGE